MKLNQLPKHAGVTYSVEAISSMNPTKALMAMCEEGDCFFTVSLSKASFGWYLHFSWMEDTGQDVHFEGEYGIDGEMGQMSKEDMLKIFDRVIQYALTLDKDIFPHEIKGYVI